MCGKLLLTTFLVISLNYSFAQPKLVGLCAQGGEQFGTIMKYTAGNSALDGIFNFPGNPGTNPTCQLVKAGNKLYGITAKGGKYDKGILFEFDPATNMYINNFDFFQTQGNYPRGSLVLAPNGKLYGCTSNGGTNDKGVLFEYNYLTGIYTKKIEFSINLGSNPNGNMIVGPNGNLYGMTHGGGLNGRGVIFEYDFINNQYMKRIDLDLTNGCYPYGALAIASNGKMYGMTSEGGINNEGVIFEYTASTNSYIKKIDLDSALGSSPHGSLQLALNGKFYGLTSSGGEYDGGVVFEYDPVLNLYDNKKDLDAYTGFEPQASFIRGINGKLYATAKEGGAQGTGAIFEYDYVTNNITILHDCINSTGNRPTGTLFQDSNGMLYGVMSREGTSTYNGTLFRFDLSSGTFSALIEFASLKGDRPIGKLIEGTNGKFYGITESGGSSKGGTIFEFDYNANTVTTKFNFPYITHPGGYLVPVGNGVLYGLSYVGGIIGAYEGHGKIFSYDYLNDSYSVKYTFLPPGGGSFRPVGALLLASNGKLYGTTSGGGNNGDGALYEYDPILEVFTKIFDFNAFTTGDEPTGYLTEPINGKLYGIMQSGSFSQFSTGLIFEYDIVTGIYTIKYKFSTDGKHPVGGLLHASNGKLYGVTRAGGLNNMGVLFEFDISTAQYVKKYDFDQASGFNMGVSKHMPLFEASDGKIYGTAKGGGTFNEGVIFQYDFINNTYMKLVDLESGITGTNAISTFSEVLCPAPFISSSGSSSICQGDSVVLNSVGGISGHQWYRNGIIIPGATGATYTATMAGKYSLNATVCSSQLPSNEIKVRIVCFPPHDEERLAEVNHLSEINIWYDASSDQLFIHCEDAFPTGVNISLYDMNGKLLLSENLISESNYFTKEINLSAIEKGIYFVKIASENDQVVRKFIK